MKGQRVIMITDSRVGRDHNGRIATNDPALAGRGWWRGLLDPEMHYCLRVNPEHGSAHMPIEGTVHPLPHYIGLAGFAAKSVTTVREVWRITRTFDVVVTRLPGIVGVCAVVCAAIQKRPLAVEVVGDPWDSNGGHSASKRVLAITGAVLLRLAVKRAGAVRYVTRETLQKRYPPNSKAEVVAFSSVDLGSWVQEPTHAESAWPTVVAVGSQQQMYKGHDLLIRAMVLVRKTHPTARLVLVGDGHYQESLRQMVRERNLDSAVTFAGHISDKSELIRIVDQAWIYAMPSRAEGMPRALLEAMARGKPCVATRVGGIPEVLDNRQLVEREDVAGIASLLNEMILKKELRSELRDRNLSIVDEYQPETLKAKAELWTRIVASLSASQVGM